MVSKLSIFLYQIPANQLSESANCTCVKPEFHGKFRQSCFVYLPLFNCQNFVQDLLEIIVRKPYIFNCIF